MASLEGWSSTIELHPLKKQSICGGGSRIRTCVDVRRQIYSLLPLTARPSLQTNTLQEIRDLEPSVNWELHSIVKGFFLDEGVWMVAYSKFSEQINSILIKFYSNQV